MITPYFGHVLLEWTSNALSFKHHSFCMVLAVLVFQDFTQTQNLATTAICPSHWTILATNFVLLAQRANIACFSRSNLSHDHLLFLTSWEPHLCPAFAAVDFSSSGGFAFFTGLIPKYESSVELRFFPGMVQKIMILFC